MVTIKSEPVPSPFLTPGVFDAIRTCSECLGTSLAFIWGRTHESVHIEHVLVVFFVTNWFFGLSLQITGHFGSERMCH